MSVHTTASGTHEVRYRIPHPTEQGKWIQKQKTFKRGKYSDAKDFDRKIHTQVSDGDYIPEVSLTVKEVMEKWLAAKKPSWKIQTYNGHKGHVENYIVPKLGHIKATSLRFVDIETAGAEWGKALSAKTVNDNLYDDISRAFKFAKKLGVKHNPVADVERLVQKKTPEELEAEALGIADHGDDTPETKSNVLRAVGADEVYSVLELKKIIDASRPGLEKARHMLAICLGLRHGELNALRWDTKVVNLKQGTIFVNRSLTQLKGKPILERPKTKNAYRTLKMPPELLSELRRWKLQCPPSPNGFVLCDEAERPMNRKQNNRDLKACCVRAGVRPLSMNNIRHSFASQHLIGGASALEVCKMMGHSDPGVTLKVYSKWAEREESTSQNDLANRIFSAEETEEATGSE